MLKRTLMFCNPAKLYLRDNQIKISLVAEEEERSVPIEDVGIIIIDNQQVSLTVPLVNALSEQNVVVVFCNAKGIPQSILQPISGNNTQGENLRMQVSVSEPLRKNLWKQIVEQKIRNQMLLLQKLGKNADLLKFHYKNVLSGDSDNREGLAARLYWLELMGDDFVRDRDEEGINSLLNYGYAILRSATIRALVGSGLMPSIGVFHHNRSNPFPLADDLMEPYRPYVDEIVYGLCEEGKFCLNKETKSALANILTYDTIFDKVCRPLQVGLTLSSASLVRCYDKVEKKLVFPNFQ